MTRPMGWLAVAALITGLAAPALAQERPRGGLGLMGALDRNGNGKLEPEEIDLAVASLRKLDKNGDGDITGEEIWGEGRGSDRRPGAPGPGGGPRRGLPDFSQLDKDGDGKISKEEAPERMRARFDQMDANGDGFFDKAEQEQVLKMLRERFQRGRPGGRPDRDEGAGGTERPRRPDSKE